MPDVVAADPAAQTGPTDVVLPVGAAAPTGPDDVAAPPVACACCGATGPDCHNCILVWSRACFHVDAPALVTVPAGGLNLLLAGNNGISVVFDPYGGPGDPAILGVGFTVVYESWMSAVDTDTGQQLCMLVTIYWSIVCTPAGKIRLVTEVILPDGTGVYQDGGFLGTACWFAGGPASLTIMLGAGHNPNIRRHTQDLDVPADCRQPFVTDPITVPELVISHATTGSVWTFPAWTLALSWAFLGSPDDDCPFTADDAIGPHVCTAGGEITNTYGFAGNFDHQGADCAAWMMIFDCCAAMAWDCVGGVCKPVVGGPYASQAECQAPGACNVPATARCNTATGCFDPGDGTGEFTGPDALANCNAACTPSRYSCIGGVCQPTFGGTFDSWEACDASGCGHGGDDPRLGCCPGGAPNNFFLGITSDCLCVANDNVEMVWEPGEAAYIHNFADCQVQVICVDGTFYAQLKCLTTGNIIAVASLDGGHGRTSIAEAGGCCSGNIIDFFIVGGTSLC